MQELLGQDKKPNPKPKRPNSLTMFHTVCTVSVKGFSSVIEELVHGEV